MNLKNLKISEHFDGGLEDNFLSDFYLPALKNSMRYDRVAGYFSPKSLSAVAEGMSQFIQNKGKYRLIFSKHINSEEDYESIKAGYTNQFDDELLDDIKKLELMLKDNPRKILGWMIANDFLEIKIGFKKPDDGGMLHSKWGNFEDPDGNRLNYNGSINESANSLLNQIESANIFTSWDNEIDKKRVENSFRKFDIYWNNLADKVEVVDFPKVCKERLLINNDLKTTQDVLVASDQLTKDLIEINSESQEIIVEESGPREYQQEAIDKLVQNNFKGILALATGLGKTYTSLFALKEYAKSVDNAYYCSIVVPSETLIYQWADEIEKILGIQPFILRDRSKKELQQAITNLNIEFEDNIICLVTYQSFYKDDYKKIINECQKPLAIICDEVHNAGAPKWKQGLINNFDCRIALSATPKRYFDDEGSDLIYTYFDKEGCFYEKDLAWGIENGFLCPYRYHINLVDLTNDELQDYKELTRKMAPIYDKPEFKKHYENLLLQRAEIIKTAYNKYEAFENLISELNYDLNGGFIYCGTKDFLENIQSILNEKGMRYMRFISGTSTQARKDMMSRFKNQKLDAIIAMNCLDEGVDIPNAETAIILASSNNSKQYIQRRGRVLRKPYKESKKIADIYDFICIPPADPSISFLMQQNLIKKQLERIDEFSHISLNHDENSIMIENLKEEWKIEE